MQHVGIKYYIAWGLCMFPIFGLKRLSKGLPPVWASVQPSSLELCFAFIVIGLLLINILSKVRLVVLFRAAVPYLRTFKLMLILSYHHMVALCSWKGNTFYLLVYTKKCLDVR
jgi:hypothetical protein